MRHTKLVIIFLFSFFLMEAHSRAMPIKQTSLADMLEKAMPAVVNLTIAGEIPLSADALNELESAKGNDDGPSPDGRLIKKYEAVGSGVIMDAKRGYIITNAHIVKFAKTITVTLHDGRTFQATLLGLDNISDIAVLKIPTDNLNTIPVGNSSTLRIGDFVVAIGNPFGLNFIGSSQTATFGMISALRRPDMKIDGYDNFIQTDAALNFGSSGGALVNLSGELIGINTGLLAPISENTPTNTGVGFAIPINMAINIMQQIIKYGSTKRGLMGIFVQRFTPELAKAFQIPNEKGALVSQVDDNSEAFKAGVKPGDLIQGINGQTIENFSEVRNIIGLLRIGDPIHLSILRDKKKITIRTKLKDPKTQQQTRNSKNPYFHSTSLKNIVEQSPIHGLIRGVQLLNLSESSAAWLAGLRPGDVIIKANNQVIQNLTELHNASQNTKGTLLVHLIRGPGALYLVIET